LLIIGVRRRVGAIFFIRNTTGYAVDSADLLYRKGSFWLHVVVTIPTPDVTDNREAVGVDLELTHPSCRYFQPAVSRQKALAGRK
jgi:hypothetical protein